MPRRVAVFRNGIAGVPCAGSPGRATRASSRARRRASPSRLTASSWVLLNASPDLRAQLLATPALHPRGGTRGSPIAAVVLTGAEVDQVAGLLTLRERAAFHAARHRRDACALAANPMFGVLAADVVTPAARSRSASRFALPGGLEAELFAVPGKVPLYLEGDDPALAAETGANVGVEIVCGARAARSMCPAPPR